MSRVPSNFLIGGVFKAGTTSLFNHLATHSGICPALMKETRYFSQVLSNERTTHDTYEAYFPDPSGARYLMDGSPGYLYGGAALARIIEARCRSPRIVFIVRDPSTRLRSFFNFQKSRLHLPNDMCLEEYVAACQKHYPENAKMDSEIFKYHGIQGGLYARHLEPWFETFDESIKVLFFEDMISAPELFLGDLLQWLDLSVEEFMMPSFDHHNRTTGFNNRILQRYALLINRRCELLWRRFPRTKRTLRKLYYRANGTEYQREELPAQTIDQYFTAENTRLRTLLLSQGYTEFPEWLSLTDKSSAQEDV